FEEGSDISPEPELPEWLLEVPEDLDVCIAQRHFEEAYNLLERAQDYLNKGSDNNKDPVLTDIRRKVDARAKALTEVLMKELEVSPDKSLQGGLRAARRAVRLLNQLGRATQVCVPQVRFVVKHQGQCWEKMKQVLFFQTHKYINSAWFLLCAA
ncbi:unnamed protein product, partial [Timema podura]|nr:unnamed protein product [Timema podura]